MWVPATPSAMLGRLTLAAPAVLVALALAPLASSIGGISDLRTPEPKVNGVCVFVGDPEKHYMNSDVSTTGNCGPTSWLTIRIGPEGVEVCTQTKCNVVIIFHMEGEDDRPLIFP